ncbi:spindle pole body interacting protein [Aureobasidium pullulans]|nr:spindle pole body interacting protein [Aureobasidium pullulans]THY82731.1 spindle pole body interacting protein [Aureobasidium pullulans]
MAQPRQHSSTGQTASIAPAAVMSGGTTASRRPSLASFPSRKQSFYDVMPSATVRPPMRPSLSQSVRSPTMPHRKRKPRPQYPQDSTERHVEYILVASFDIDTGSIMEHQYPTPIGGDEQMLAELMLPDQTHLRSQDWTVFFLHKDQSPEEELQQRRDDRRQRRAEKKKLRPETKPVATEADMDNDSEDDTEDAESEDDAVKSTQGPPLVYVLNLVNTKHDVNVKRGAVVKAMAICTRHSFLHIYKPLLLLALEEYFRTPTIDTLASLYESVNNMDLSLLPRLSFQERYILQASDVKDLFLEKFEAMVHKRVQQDKKNSQSDDQQQTPRQRYALPRDTHEFDSVVKYNNIPVPIKIPTALSLETVGDFSLIKLIQTFSTPHSASPQPFTQHHPHLTTSGPLTHPIIVLMNALLSQKRIIFIGHNLPSSEVAEAVLAACSLASGGFLRGFTRHAFPYTDLTKIEDLLKVPGFIAGVTNPAFATHTEWWDLMCDLPTGRIRISPKIEQAPLTEGVLFFQQSAPGMPQPFNAPGPVSSAGTATGTGMGGFPSIPSGAGDPTGDVAFMSSVLASIAERRGEGAVRSKFRLWILKFIRIAAAFEELVYGASAIFAYYPPGSPISPATATMDFPSPMTVLDAAFEDPAVAGHGYVWPSQEAKMRELAANATRIEGWTKTRSYYNFIQDFSVMFSLRPIQDLDLQHLHDKLTKLRLGTEASASIYLALCARVKTYEQVNQLLSVFAYGSPAVGNDRQHGMFYLSLGLMHPRLDVRESVAALVDRIRVHEAGRHFWAALGRFEQAAFDRVVLAKAEREEGGGLLV